MIPFSKPVALVTGGASFLGKAISLKLAVEGFDLILHYQSSLGKTQELALEAGRLGAKTKLVKADLRKTEQTRGLIQKAVGFFRRLDFLVNNASLFYPTPPSRPKPGQWREMIDTNLLSPYFLSLAAAPWLTKTRGSIVNLTDIYGENPILKNYAAYCTSKAGLIAATKILSRELGPSIRVNAVSPGAIFIPKSYSRKQREQLLQRSTLKRQGTPEDIAEAVYFLASQKFITGHILKVDGGRF